MKLFNKILSLILFLFIFFLLNVSKIEAISVFSENFDSYPDDSFPTNWTVWPSEYITLCNAQWIIKNGMIGAPIIGESCITNIMPNDIIWGDLGDNYIFDVDMKFVSGTDHNVLFRVKPDNPGFAAHEIHFGSPGDFSFTPDSFPGIYNTHTPGLYDNGNTYHLKIIVNENNFKTYIDGQLVRDYSQFNNNAPHGRIGLRSGTGADPVSETWFDNIKVEKISNNPPNLPNKMLDIPLLSQKDILWGSKIYDSADLWSPSNPTIYSWGCALTSAVMVLNYHGIKKFPDKTTINPGSLNEWLKKQRDGYIGNGLLNWNALTRLSLLSKQSNKITKFNALEFKKTRSNNLDIIKEHIEMDTPDIVEVPGHFLVAKGFANNDISINDPYFDKTLLSQHNQILTINTFTPSFTDLSYIIITTSSDTNIELNNSQDQKIAETNYESGINDPLNNTQSNTNLKTIYFPKPQEGNYKIKLTSNSFVEYKIEILLYDKKGNIMPSINYGSISAGEEKIIPVTITNLNNFYPSKESLNSLSKDITLAFSKKQIKTSKLRLEIEQLIIKARIEESLGKKTDELNTLRKLEELIVKNYNSQIIDPGYSKILYDIRYLQTHI